METPDNTINYELDELNRITEVNVNNMYTVGYTYDKDGNRDVLTYPDGSTVDYDYDGEGNIKKITDGDTVTEYKYDANGNRSEEYVNEELNKMYTYDTTADYPMKTTQRITEQSIFTTLTTEQETL